MLRTQVGRLARRRSSATAIEMKATALRIGFLAATLAALALPASAPAEYLVPPSNSAVNQYTETYPTAGGQKQSGEGRQTKRHPAKVLGPDNAQRLDAQGPDGRAAAELAAETAPGAVDAEASGGGGGQAPEGGSGSTEGSASGGQKAGGSGAAPVAADNGSSGLGSVVSQATGSSSDGALGLLLPLAILAAIAWSIFYLVRQRKRPTA
jgi:hypothetical protein